MSNVGVFSVRGDSLSIHKAGCTATLKANRRGHGKHIIGRPMFIEAEDLEDAIVDCKERQLKVVTCKCTK